VGTYLPTVQVDEKTLQLLARIKMGARSYNQLIKTLILERKGIPYSMFGSNPKLTSFSEREQK
jgi:hypothetical protein